MKWKQNLWKNRNAPNIENNGSLKEIVVTFFFTIKMNNYVFDIGENEFTISSGLLNCVLLSDF